MNPNRGKTERRDSETNGCNVARNIGKWSE